MAGGVPDDWEVLLRCPNCEWSELGVYDQATVDRFDGKMPDNGTEVLVRDLRRLVQANMEDEAERFAAALNADAILPEDFEAPTVHQPPGTDARSRGNVTSHVGSKTGRSRPAILRPRPSATGGRN